MKDKAQIERAIEALKWEYSELPQFSVFGDNNRAQRDARIGVLRLVIDLEYDDHKVRWLIDEIYDSIRYDDETQMAIGDDLYWVLDKRDDLDDTIKQFLESKEA